jgi:transposase
MAREPAVRSSCGYLGKRAMVARLVVTWSKGGKRSRPNAPERISPKHTATLVTRAVDQMTEVQQRLFDRISAQCPDVIELRQMALAFRAALTGGDAAKLRLWIEGARRCEYAPVVRLAYGLRKDLLAVSADVETSWSTGQVEGQINRLKMIKRQMYGRAFRASYVPACCRICPRFASGRLPDCTKIAEAQN